MKTIHFITLLISGFIATSLNAQFFSEDFTPPINGWAVSGTTAICCGSTAPPGSMQITNGQLELRAFRGSQTYRLNKSIGQTLNAYDKWTLEFEITPLVANRDNAAIFTLTDNTDHWFSDNAGDFTQNNTSSVQIICSDPLGSNDQLRVFIRGKYQNTNGTASTPILVYPNTHYYVRAERLSSNKVSLSIFSDMSRTQHIAGSPVCHEINANIGGLNNFQFASNTIANPDRISDLNLDNVNIYNDPVQGCGGDVCVVNADMVIDKDPESCKYFFTNTSTEGPGNTIIGSVIDFGDSTYMEVAKHSTVEHSYSPGGFYNPCITTFSYYFDGIEYVCCSNTKCYSLFFEGCHLENESNLPLPENCLIEADFDFELACLGKVNFQDNSLMAIGNYLTTLVDFGDGSNDKIDLGESFQHYYSNNGYYEVCITIFGYFWNGDMFECCSKRICKSFEITNVVGDPCAIPGGSRLKFDSSTEQQFTISPNPVNEVLNIQLLDGVNTIRITNLQGKLINELIEADKKHTNIQMRDLPNGVYLISIQNGQTIENKKIIKQ